MVTESFETFATGAVLLDWSVPTSGFWLGATLNFSAGAAPTTAGNVELIFKSVHGVDYDSTIYSVDPSSPASESVYMSPDVKFPVNRGDKIQVKYANPDNLKVAVIIKGQVD